MENPPRAAHWLGIFLSFAGIGFYCAGCSLVRIRVDPIIPQASKVAVIAYHGDKPYVDDASVIEGTLLRMNFGVVDRMTFQAALDEQLKSAEGMVSPSQAIQIGKMAAARYLLLSTRTDYSNGITQTMRLIDAESGQVVNTASCAWKSGFLGSLGESLAPACRCTVPNLTKVLLTKSQASTPRGLCGPESTN